MIKKGISALSVACLWGTLFSCQSSTSSEAQEITLKNRSDIALTDKAIAVNRSEFSNIPDGEVYPLLLTQNGDTIAAQLDDLDGDNKWDELLLVTNLPANGEQVLQLTWVNAPLNHTIRTNIRFGKRSGKDIPLRPATSDTIYANQMEKSIGYQPYQTDGPSWENDKVGFRHYLDGRNSKDLFGKKTTAMSPDSVGISKTGAVEDNYHVMRDWGRDIMAVGSSVGIGGVAMMVGDSFPRIGIIAGDTVSNVESTSFQILARGPVHSKMQISYNNWKPANTDRSYTITENPAITPGMYAYQNTVEVTSGLTGDETLLIGMNNLDETFPLEEMQVGDNWVALLTHDSETYNKEWLLPLALLVPKSAYLGYTASPKTGPVSQAWFAKLKPTEKVTYYAIGTWELSDEHFKNLDYFRNYVKQLAQQLDAKVDVSVK
ncbi:DUF4861 domain-containing protein [Pontibacter qinzhouensis]|uniref:DUF4861 domain-containing protein n=1 Tax=Pontibacter qinzhouensis TaxID=2603253 RepID=A0A5C8JM28_9BACT|nr:DUF4861 family protein [Pontibacter qinzhouensis]TXK37883.1 DUF4861 domain-containing protein [Pontibacter qinzhouensis]